MCQNGLILCQNGFHVVRVHRAGLLLPGSGYSEVTMLLVNPIAPIKANIVDSLAFPSVIGLMRLNFKMHSTQKHCHFLLKNM